MHLNVVSASGSAIPPAAFTPRTSSNESRQSIVVCGTVVGGDVVGTVVVGSIVLGSVVVAAVGMVVATSGMMVVGVVNT